MKKFTIVCDSREKPNHRWNLEQFNDDCFDQIVVDKLDTGDYTIGQLRNLMAIERKKSPSEVAGNISEKRFADCINRMAKLKYKFIILEFSIDDVLKYPVGSNIPRRVWSKIKVGSSHILGFLTHLSVKHGIHVIWAGDRDNAALVALKI